jgi:ribonuclease HII
VTATYRIGADENGLGSRLGPLVVTGVLARVDERGTRALGRKLPARIREDLDDSKRLISHADYALGEAWARALTNDVAENPTQLFELLSLEGTTQLSAPCPSHVRAQCWKTDGETFQADAKVVQRVRKHCDALRERGIELLGVQSSVVCTKRLNDARELGLNRFISDLHAMEALTLSLRKKAGADVHAVCGKVGGIGVYPKFFGPLSGWLHVVLAEGQAKSSYRFPGLGELHFVRDADASDPLVSLASLVGKYLREVLMGRIANHYGEHFEGGRPSGYHDPITASFVEQTALIRRKRRVPATCFERARDNVESVQPEVAAL